MNKHGHQGIGLLVSYTIISLLLFFYSFTQVDLGLTLSRHPFVVTFQKAFQYVGYFNRPLSTLFYLIIVLAFFTIYTVGVNVVHKNHVTKHGLWKTILLTTGILTFSYNAFSYDLFNYIFDAKIFTFYHQNPYLHKALDFPQDPMLGFMHWTHVVYPYGPVWLIISIVLSYLGLHLFAINLILFKLCMALSFLGTVYFIGKILQIINPKYELLGVALFALNPFVLIESLVSAHNDIVMFFLSTLALYLLIKKQYVTSWITFIFSVGIKFASEFLVPVFLYVTFFRKRIKEWDYIILLAILCMTAAIFAATFRTQFQPWYLLYVFPLVALLPHRYTLVWPMYILSLCMMLYYVPFLYTGNWNPPIPFILRCLVGSGVGMSLLAVGGRFLVLSKKKHE